MSDSIRFVVALDCEARPLLKHYRMTRDRLARGFAVYRNDAGCALIVTGPGRIAAAAGSAYLYARFGSEEPAAWINIGVAGHQTAGMGSVFIANKIQSATNSNVWYPPLTINSRIAEAAVVTVDEPETDFVEDAVYDMEAAGYYPTICRFVTSELVQALKVISDNRRTKACRDQQIVAQLIGDTLPVVAEIAAQTAALAAELAGLERTPGDFEYWLGNLRFSEMQRHQLQDRLYRLECLAEQSQGIHQRPVRGQFQSSKQLLAWLDRELRKF